jgi:hypothetical protein
MRYFRAPSLFHLRLGWLDVLVRLVGAGARPLAVLHGELLERAEQFNAWRANAGLTEPPHGALMPSHVGALARMIASFGLYDDRSERLNDAGHVLLATPEEARSPFLWEGARRWIGLWLLMRADGDVTAAILRSWSAPSLRSRNADDLVIKALTRLAARVGDIEGDDLLGQARRATETSNGRRTIVSSRLELLRELGYCARLPSVAGYRLTERGERLRGALRGDFAERDADELLRAGLSRCYLLGEGVKSAPAASFDALVEGFRLCPEGLRVADDEAPLAPLVAWIQWSLLQQGPPFWLDDARIPFGRIRRAQPNRSPKGSLAVCTNGTRRCGWMRSRPRSCVWSSSWWMSSRKPESQTFMAPGRRSPLARAIFSSPNRIRAMSGEEFAALLGV